MSVGEEEFCFPKRVILMFAGSEAAQLASVKSKED